MINLIPVNNICSQKSSYVNLATSELILKGKCKVENFEKTIKIEDLFESMINILEFKNRKRKKPNA